MKYFSRLFWVCLGLFTANQMLEKMGVFIPYLHSYFDDFLCPAIVLGFTLSFQQQLSFRNPGYTFSYWHVIVFVVWYFVLFEGIFPAFDSRHYSDPLDLLAYAAGGILFYNAGNNPAPGLLHFRLGKNRC